MDAVKKNQVALRGPSLSQQTSLAPRNHSVTTTESPVVTPCLPRKLGGAKPGEFNVSS
jgi:hypothetical protein